MFCEKCGKAVAVGASYCGHCGNALGDVPVSGVAPPLDAPAQTNVPMVPPPVHDPKTDRNEKATSGESNTSLVPRGMPRQAEQQQPRVFRFGAAYIRWVLWIGMVGLGFGLGEAIWLAVTGRMEMGLITIFANLLGYAAISPIVALPACLLGLLRTTPVRIATGIAIALSIGTLVGLGAGQRLPAPSPPSAPSAPVIGNATQPPPSPNAANDGQSLRASCYASYSAKQYADVSGKCLPYVVTLMPRLMQLRASKDFKSTADLSAEMFDVTDMTVESYRALGKNELGRNQALHAAGWAILYFASLDSTDKDFASSHSTTTQRITTNLKVLEREFPGVIEAERKAFSEAP